MTNISVNGLLQRIGDIMCRYAGGSPNGVKAQVHVLMLLTQWASGAYVVLAKNALSDGLHKLVFSVYRNAFGLILLIPFAYFYER